MSNEITTQPQPIGLTEAVLDLWTEGAPVVRAVDKFTKEFRQLAAEHEKVVEHDKWATGRWLELTFAIQTVIECNRTLAPADKCNEAWIALENVFYAQNPDKPRIIRPQPQEAVVQA